VELASMLEVDRYRVEEWLSHAQLLTIRDVDGRIAGVLYELGIRTLDQLAQSHPETLAAAFNGQVERTGRKRVTQIDAARVTPWIVAARNFLGQQPPAASNDPIPPAPPQPPAA
jgi:predicted RecB family nuclease